MGNKYIRHGLMALSLLAQSLASVAQAASLPTHELAVSGQAVLYRKPADIAALQSDARQEIGQIDATSEAQAQLAAEGIAGKLIAASQPVLSVTGVELSPLPVSLPNQLRALAMALPSGLSLDVGISRQTNYHFSNLVLDVKTLTLWGDVTVKSANTPSAPGSITSEWTAVPLMTTGGVATGADFHSAYADPLTTDPVAVAFQSAALPVPAAAETLWWPDTSAWDPNASVAALRASGRSGIASGPSQGSVAIWLADLRLVPDFSVAQASARTGRTVGDMLITVNVQAVPEPATHALWALGVLGLVLVRRKTKG